MTVEFTVAQRVKGILASSGHNDEKRRGDGFLSREGELAMARRVRDEAGPQAAIRSLATSGDYFTSNPDGNEAVVTYWGSVHREEERLRVYRLAIENCMFQVAEEDDPEREGRKRLRVARCR